MSFFKWRSAPMLASLWFAVPAYGETPEIRAARLSAQAAEQEADAEAELPPPEVMLEVWRVPVNRPYDVANADMVRLGFEQEFTAPGERAGMQRAARLRGAAQRAEGQSRQRALALRLAHAQAELRQVEASHHLHRAHLALAQRTLVLAQARHAAGGALTDATLAEVEVARAEAEVASDAARIQSASELVNALQGAAGVSPVGSGERPELAALRLARDAEQESARAERARSAWPDFRVGASYFAPTMGRDEHGFGVTVGMKVPWLWGARSGRAQAAASRAQALEAERAAKQRDLRVDAVVARAQLRAAEGRLRVTRTRTLPLVERNQQLALSSYETATGKLDDALRAEAMRIDVAMEVVELEAEIAHLQLDVAYLESGTNAAREESKHAR